MIYFSTFIFKYIIIINNYLLTLFKFKKINFIDFIKLNLLLYYYFI